MPSVGGPAARAGRTGRWAWARTPERRRRSDQIEREPRRPGTLRRTRPAARATDGGGSGGTLLAVVVAVSHAGDPARGPARAPPVVWGTRVCASAPIPNRSEPPRRRHPAGDHAWGNTAAEDRIDLTIAPRAISFPGVFPAVTPAAIDLLGDRPRDALDPRPAELMGAIDAIGWARVRAPRGATNRRLTPPAGGA